MSFAQPAMIADNGVLVTIGMMVGKDRAAIVFPIATGTADLGKTELCRHAGLAVKDGLCSMLKACMGSDCSLEHISVEAMLDGYIPSRIDLAALGTNGGTGTPPSMPAQVAGLLVFYADPADLPPGGRMRVGKTFVPGIPQDLVAGDKLLSDELTALTTLANAMGAGFTGVTYPEETWYRVLAAPRPRGAVGQSLKRTIASDGRAYVVTQKRRLTPRV